MVTTSRKTKEEIARAIAKSYMDCQKRLKITSRLEAARNELLNLSMLLDVYSMTANILKEEYGMNMDSVGKAE